MSDTETIYVEVGNDASASYVEIEARRTNENFFEIVSEPPGENVRTFKRGDVVRCAWRYFGSGFDGGIVAISLSSQNLQDFSVGDRVLVSEHAGWSNSFYAKITSDPEFTENRLGPQTLYWIEFESPQKDREGDDEYSSAEISSIYLKTA